MDCTKGTSLDEIKKEAIDMKRAQVDEVLELLKSTRQGLTSEEAENRQKIVGPNKLEAKKKRKLLKFFSFMWNPLSWAMGAAALINIVFVNGDGRPPNFMESCGIVSLLIVNSTISLIEEEKACNAAAALMDRIAPKTKVLRDGRWSEQDAEILVPGDIISIRLGDIIPADACLLEGDVLKVDQSALIWETLSVTKSPLDMVFSGSTCTQGEIEAVVVAIGAHTFVGKAGPLEDSTNQVGDYQKFLTAIANFCIYFILIGIIVEIIIIMKLGYRVGAENLLVLLIGGNPIAIPTMLSVTMAIASQVLSKQGTITKRMAAIEEMTRMDILCSDTTGTLTSSKLTVDKSLIEVFVDEIDKDQVILLAARASRTNSRDATDAAIVEMLADPTEARAGIREVHFSPSVLVEKRTTLTYIDSCGNWHRACKGVPEQILEFCHGKEDVRKKVDDVIDKFAQHGLRSIGVATQEVPEKTKESTGGPWQLVGVLPLFDTPRPDSAETIKRALNHGVNVKIMTGDQLAIAKEAGRRLGMGTNMWSSSLLLGLEGESIATFPVDELIEKADGFAGVIPEHKCEIVKRLQDKKHICGMTVDGVNDSPGRKKADISIAVANATDAARAVSDIVLTEPGLSVIISEVLTSRDVFQKMQNYTVYAVSVTTGTVLSLMILALLWNFEFTPFLILIMVKLNSGTIMAISRERVKRSPIPESCRKLREVLIPGVLLGGYLALGTLILFWQIRNTTFFSDKFGVKPLKDSHEEMRAVIYLQVSIMNQALFFVIRSRGLSFAERPGIILLIVFLICQLVTTLIAVYAHWSSAKIKGCGWGWAGVTWVYSIITYILLDLLKFCIHCLWSGKAWNCLLENMRTLLGLQPPETTSLQPTFSPVRTDASSSLILLNKPNDEQRLNGNKDHP